MSEFMTVAGARSMVAGLEAAMSLAPRVDTAAQLAAVYSTLSRDREALKLIEFVWGRWQNIENGMNYAMMLQDVCEWGRAARIAETAHWLDPENQYGKLLYAESLLRQGLWKQAWPLYNEGRPTTLGERTKMGLPGIYRQWDGRQLGADEFLFVLMEGGSGDRINYARWLPLLDSRAPNWKVFCYAELAPLFLRWLDQPEPEGNDLPIYLKHGHVVREDEMTLPSADGLKGAWWTTVFCLPGNFGAGPADVPQWDNAENGKAASSRRTPKALRASGEKRERYKIPKPADGLPLVGLCWAARELSICGDPEARKIRSLSEAQAMRLVCQTAHRAHWISLQQGRPLGWPVQEFPGSLETWDDTAGLLENLDCLLTVDTGVLHLGGAMCKPLGILLGSHSDWKFLDRGKCPFYPGAKLYRNGPRADAVGGNFENAVNQAIVAIREKGLGAFG